MDTSTLFALSALTLSIASLLVSYISYKDRHGHQKLNFTFEYLRDWDEKTLHSRAKIMEIQDVYEKATPDVIPLDTIISLRSEQLRKIDRGELPSGTLLITDHITILLNYIDQLASGINMGIIDEQYIYDDLGQAILRWFNALREYRSEFDNKPEKRTSHPWRKGEALIKKWTTLPPSPTNPSPPGSR